MPDTNDLLKLIKETALAAVKASKPVNIVFGKVVDASPKIQIDQKLILGERQLIFTKNVTDHQVVIKGENVTIKNGLVVGDEVILIRQQEGQKFIVLDRIEK